MWKGRSVLAVVPARAGSKGIARKNLVRVGGRTLIEHAARAALALTGVDRAVLSTDDDEMADEGRRCGLAVPFRRPAVLASDEATAADAWAHAWLASEAAFGERYDVSLWLQPTTPLRDVSDVERTLATLVEGDLDSAATVSPIPAHLRPERAMTLGPACELAFYASDGAAHANRQTIPTTWFRNGVCYAATRATVVDERRTIGVRAAGVPVPGPVVSIDDVHDLEVARLLARRADA